MTTLYNCIIRSRVIEHKENEMQDSYRHIHKDGSVSLSGPDAIAFYRTIQLRNAIGLYAKTGLVPTRSMTIKKMLAAATAITQKKYTHNPRGYALAMIDLDAWISTMKTALPTTDERPDPLIAGCYRTEAK